ncbi:hypothetical protein JXA85_08820 [Candidatus Woesearchaeota archaeon]|nr:hypothetical protein [Candidatus Woesearchaeota archaeon]
MKWEIFLLIAVLLCSQVQADIISEVQELSSEIEAFCNDNTVIVKGEYASKGERMLLSFLKEKYPAIEKLSTVGEMDYSPNGNAFLIGGPYQNSYTKQIIGSVPEVKRKETTAGTIIFLKSETEQYVVFSDPQGFSNNPRTGPRKSPLAKIMPVEYVPAAATAIGFSLIWLWKFLAILFRKAFNLIVSGKAMKLLKKKKISNKTKGFEYQGIKIKYREWVSILGAAVVFAVAKSYEFLISEEMLAFILASILVNTVIYSIRHFTRLTMDKLHDSHTEYVFWIWGGIVTIISGWLGNTFSVAGYTVSHKKSEKEAKISYMIDILTFAASIVFMILNLIFPSTLLQMSMLLAMAIAYLQMIPVSPLNGKKIYAWNRKLWWGSFIPMTVIYVLVNVLI